MDRLPVVHKTKLTKDQTYFVNAAGLSRLLDDSPQIDNIELRFSDDPSQFKSNYDRFVKHENKLVILSARYTAPTAEQEEAPMDACPYCVTVYAIQKTIRDDLIAKFDELHFATLREWLDEPRDDTWLKSNHAIQFLIDIESEEIQVAYDIDFDSYSRHSQKQRFRTDVRKH